MSRKIFGVVVCLLLIVTFGVFAVHAEEVKKLSLEEVLSTVLEQDIELKIAKLNLENAKLEYQKSKANNLLSQSRYAELNAEYDLANAEKTYQQVYNKIISNTLQLYTNVVLSEMNIEIKTKSVTLEEQLLAEMKQQVEMGDKGTLDLLQQKSKTNNASFTLEKTKDTYQQNVKELQSALGRQVNLIGLAQLKYPTFWEMTEAEAINTALKNSIDLQLKEKRLELAEVNKERMDVVSTSDLDKDITENKLKSAGLEVEQASEDLSSSAQKKYYEFKQAITKLELDEENLKVSTENYRITKEQKEAGLKTNKDLLQAEINLLEQEYQYQQALFDYYMKQLALKQAMEIETEVVINDFTENK